MPGAVTVEELRSRARRVWDRDGRKWAAGCTDSAIMDIPLHPPTEREVLQDYDGAVAWVASWRAVDGGPIEVTWEPRQWGRVGRQAVPARVRVEGADGIAAVAGELPRWLRWRARADELAAVLGSGDGVRSAIATHGRVIGDLGATDFDRLRDVARWVARNPTSGRFVRELPIRGVGTKWLEAHRSMVEDLVRRPGLGLREPPALARIRFLDPSTAPAGITDLTAPLQQLDALDLSPSRVLIIENLQTFLALPERPGVVAVDGHGHVAPALTGVGWIRRGSGFYWGDLDSHGLHILSRARGAGLSVTSVLMDTETLFAFRDLWVPEPQPFRGAPEHLTDVERAALAALREHGNVRLEQERIDWEYALNKLDAVL